MIGMRAHPETASFPFWNEGKAICALHPLLKGYHEKYPDNNVLKKWAIDVTAGAEKAFTTHGVSVCIYAMA